MPGTGTGLDGQVGLALETSYGAPVTPTWFPEFDAEGLGRNKVTVQGTGIRAGGRFARSQRRVITTRSAAGTLSGDVVTSGMGKLFRLAAGASTNTPRAGQPTVFDQVHTPSGLLGLSATVQKGVPTTSGVVEPFTYVGCKITDLEVSIDKGGLAKFVATFDAQDEQTLGSTPQGPALAVASYALTAVPLSFLAATLTSGGVAVAGVTKANVKLSRTLKTDRFFLGAGGLKAEPLENGWQQVTGGLEADFTSRAALYDAFAADTTLGLRLAFVGPPIGATGINAGLTIDVPAAKLEGESPKVDGPDVVGISTPFVGLDNGTAPVITYTYTTADTTY